MVLRLQRYAAVRTPDGKSFAQLRVAGLALDCGYKAAADKGLDAALALATPEHARPPGSTFFVSTCAPGLVSFLFGKPFCKTRRLKVMTVSVVDRRPAAVS